MSQVKCTLERTGINGSFGSDDRASVCKGVRGNLWRHKQNLDVGLLEVVLVLTGKKEKEGSLGQWTPDGADGFLT